MKQRRAFVEKAIERKQIRTHDRIDQNEKRSDASELTFTLASRSVGEPALPSCTFMSAADEPLPLLDVGDVRLFSHEFEDEFLQTPPPAPAIELSPVSDLFYDRGKASS